MKQIALMLMGFIITTPILQAQQSEVFKSTKQLGLTLSSVTGAGINYIIPTSERDNIKLVGIYVYNNDNNEKDSFYSMGIEYQYDLREYINQRIYAFGGAHIDNSFSEETFFENKDKQEGVFSLGGGIGGDLGDPANGIIFNFHIAYQYSAGMGSNDNTRIGLGAGIGIGYNF